MVPDDVGTCPQHLRVADHLAELLAVLLSPTTHGTRRWVVGVVTTCGLRAVNPRTTSSSSLVLDGVL